MKISSFFYCIVFANVLRAESLLSKIGWNGPDNTTITLLLLSLFAVVSFFVGYYLRQAVIARKKRHIFTQKRFYELANKFALSKNELEMAEKLASYEPQVESHLIFQSISMFEKSVDREISFATKRVSSKDILLQKDRIISKLRYKIGFHRLASEHPLISTRNIVIGQHGSLFGQNSRLPIIHKATVTDSNEIYFTVEYDVDEEDMCLINTGDEIKFAFTRQGDCVYGVVLSVKSVSGNGVIEVYHTVVLRRNQLRKYVRIDASIPLHFRLLKTIDSTKSEFRRGELINAKMSDISGGGISFICEKTLRVGDIISIGFSLPQAKLTGISAKVLRISLQDGRSKIFYKHHVKFNSIEPRSTDFIVKYVFGKQRQHSQWR